MIIQSMNMAANVTKTFSIIILSFGSFFKKRKEIFGNCSHKLTQISSYQLTFKHLHRKYRSTQQTFTCLKSAKETRDKGVKYV